MQTLQDLETNPKHAIKKRRNNFIQTKTIYEFCSWLLALGDGKQRTLEKVDPKNTRNLKIPRQYQISFENNVLSKLICFIYDTNTLKRPFTIVFFRKAIVCPKKEIENEINLKILNMCPGTSKIYKSLAFFLHCVSNHGDIELLYPIEYLNLIHFNESPPHCLELKVNARVILLRYINSSTSLCNGTRLTIT